MGIASILKQLDPAKLEDFLAEVGSDLGLNRVRVVKYAAVRSNPFSPSRRKKVFDDESNDGVVLTPALVVLDELRMALGLAPRYLREALRLTGGELISVTPNLRTDLGIDYVADSLGNNGSRPAVARYMAISDDTTSPASSDTALTGEKTSGGCARAVATYSHTVGVASYTLSHTFTATTSFTALQKEGIFNAAGPPVAGTMFLENTFTPTDLENNDQLTLTHTITV